MSRRYVASVQHVNRCVVGGLGGLLMLVLELTKVFYSLGNSKKCVARGHAWGILVQEMCFKVTCFAPAPATDAFHTLGNLSC